MKFLILLTFFISSTLLAGDRNTAYNVICKGLPFESDRNKCVAKIRPFNYFNDQALAICAGLSFDSKRVECLDYIADKNYEVYEIETCKNSTFDSDKMKCLSENGAPFKKVCLPRQDVLFQLNASMSDLQSRNLGSLEKRLIFLTAKFSENCL
jgi:hypothetical protein